MDPVQHRKLVQLKKEQLAKAQAPLIKVDPHRVPLVSTPIAKDLLTESLSRRLTGGDTEGDALIPGPRGSLWP